MEKKTYELKTQYEHLANLRRAHILELTSVIFPMEEVKTSMRYGRLVLLGSFWLVLGTQKGVVSVSGRWCGSLRVCEEEEELWSHPQIEVQDGRI